MPFCLLPKYVEKLKDGFKSGKIRPERLSSMTSAERRAFLSEYVGEKNAPKVNALLEKKLLLKHQQEGLIRWAQSLIGTPKEVRRDIVSRIQRMENVLDAKTEDAFLRDLASQRIGTEVTFEEAKTLVDMASRIEKAKAEGLNEDLTWKSEKLAEEHGATLVAMKKMVRREVQGERPLITYGEHAGALGKAKSIAGDVGNLIGIIGDTLREVKAGLFDNSFFGRQFRKSATYPPTSKIWLKNYFRSFGDLLKTLGGGKESGEKILDATQAEIFSRKNYLNGNYTRGKHKLDIGTGEEMFPKSKVENIPGIGRLFAASRVTAEAGAMRMRADIADKMYAMAEKKGVNLKDAGEISAIHDLVNSMTGRGSVPFSKEIAEGANKVFFSVKFAKSTLDTFLMPITGKTEFQRNQAFGVLLSTAASTYLLNKLIASMLPGAELDEDPSSSGFGKIKYKHELIDLSGGNAGMFTLGWRMRFMVKTSATTGITQKLGEGYGTPDGLDIMWDFVENKASPIAAIVRDHFRGELFGGKKATAKNLFMDAIQPIIYSTYKDAADADGVMAGIAATALDWSGINVKTLGGFENDWNDSKSEELMQFKEKKGQETFDEANRAYNEMYQDAFEDLVASDSYKEKSDEDKKKAITSLKSKVKKNIFKQYGFKYKKK